MGPNFNFMTRYLKKLMDNRRGKTMFPNLVKNASGHQQILKCVQRINSQITTLHVNANISRGSSSLEFSTLWPEFPRDDKLGIFESHRLQTNWNFLPPRMITTWNSEIFSKWKSGIVGQLLVHLLLRPSSLPLRTRKCQHQTNQDLLHMCVSPLTLLPFNKSAKLTCVLIIGEVLSLCMLRADRGEYASLPGYLYTYYLQILIHILIVNDMVVGDQWLNHFTW